MKYLLKPSGLQYFKSASIGFLFLWLVYNADAQTQDVRFKIVSGSNGIVLGKITGITSDKHGAMWFTDQNNRCLTRYDGNTLTRYQYDPKNVNRQGGKYPECILADSAGFLWIGYYGMGIDRFDPETNTHTYFSHSDEDPGSLSSDTISAILIDHLGKLWIGTDGGLDQFDEKSGKFIHYSHDPMDSSSLSHKRVRTIYEDTQGTLWVGTGLPWDQNNKGGLNRFNREQKNFKRYLHNPKDPNSLIDNKVRSILEDSRGNFWIGTRGNGLHLLDRKTGMVTRLAPNPDGSKGLIIPAVTSPFDHFTFIKEDAAGFLWFGTLASGLIRYDPNSNTSKTYSESSNTMSGFEDNSGWWFYESPDGGPIWVSTQDDNLYQGEIFSNIIPHHSADSVVVIDMMEDTDSILWLGTITGLVRKDLRDGSIQRFVNNPQNSNSISNNLVIRVLKDSKGDIWLGTQDGLNKFDPITRTFKRFLHDPANKESLSSGNIQGLYEDVDHKLWISTFGGGINSLDIETGKVTRYLYDAGDTSSISSNLTAGLVQDKDKFIWVGTFSAGLNKLNLQTGKFSHYLPGASSRYIDIDSKGTLIASTDLGIYHFNKAADKFIPLNESVRELEGMAVYSFTEDNQQNLWLTTGTGMYRISQKDSSVLRLGSDSGIFPEMMSGSILKAKNGNLLIGTGYGFYIIDQNKLKIATAVPKIYFKSLFVNGELVKAGSQILKEPLFDTEEINLSYDQNVFSIEFNVIDYGAEGSKSVYYKLEGYDRDWRQLTSEKQVYYFGVPPGKYRFSVKGSTSSNGLTVKKDISITITPPWWKTIWSYSMYVALFGISVFSAHRIQKVRLIKKEREKTHLRELEHAREIEKAYTALKDTQEQLIHSEKMASLGELTAGIAHEIQNPLNFVNNFSEVNSELIDELEKEVDSGNLSEIKVIAKSIKENEQKIIHHGKRADAIVKGMLQHSRNSSGVKEPTDINGLAGEYLRLAYHGLRAKDKTFSASLKTDFDPTVGNVSVVPQDIARVLLNLIANACYAVSEKKKKLPGFDPTITVSTKKSGDNVLVSVKDNGIGIPQYVLAKIFQPFFTTKPTGEGPGLGLSLSYDIVKAHGGELKVETKDGEGSEFIVVLPTGPS